MIWRWKEPAQDHFVKFGHQEARIAALESDFLALTTALLESCYTDSPVLAGCLSSIIKKRALEK